MTALSRLGEVGGPRFSEGDAVEGALEVADQVSTVGIGRGRPGRRWVGHLRLACRDEHVGNRVAGDGVGDAPRQSRARGCGRRQLGRLCRQRQPRDTEGERHQHRNDRCHGPDPSGAASGLGGRSGDHGSPCGMWVSDRQSPISGEPRPQQPPRPDPRAPRRQSHNPGAKQPQVGRKGSGRHTLCAWHVGSSFPAATRPDLTAPLVAETPVRGRTP